MSVDALAVLVGVVGVGLALAALIRHEGRRTRERVRYLMRAAGIAVPDDAGLGKGESRSVEAEAPAGPANGRDIERELAALVGLRAVREPDSGTGAGGADWPRRLLPLGISIRSSSTSPRARMPRWW